MRDPKRAKAQLQLQELRLVSSRQSYRVRFLGKSPRRTLTGCMNRLGDHHTEGQVFPDNNVVSERISV